jgi:uncharacterized phage protein (TIGR01671 family)
MREHKYRAWCLRSKVMHRVLSIGLASETTSLGVFVRAGEPLADCILREYTGIKDSKGVEIYVGDIARFNNGDTFVLKIEDWLEVYYEYIGDPQCEDQTRDLYRISNATIIGNIYEHPELLEVPDLRIDILSCPFCNSMPDFPDAKDVYGTCYDAGCVMCGIATLSIQIIDMFETQEQRNLAHNLFDNDTHQYHVDHIEVARKYAMKEWNKRA